MWSCPMVETIVVIDDLPSSRAITSFFLRLPASLISLAEALAAKPATATALRSKAPRRTMELCTSAI